MRKRTAPHRYTEEEKRFLRESIAGRSYKEVTGLFNKEFGTDFEVGRIGGAIKRLGLANGRDCRFYAGMVTWNEGRKGIRVSPGTEFKKGHIPKNHHPVGAERVNVGGYIEIKVAEPRKWVLKHRRVWELERGPIPRGHAVIFADGDRENVSIDNLLLVTRGELALINKSGLPIGGGREITEAAVNIARIRLAVRGAGVW